MVSVQSARFGGMNSYLGRTLCNLQITELFFFIQINKNVFFEKIMHVVVPRRIA